MKRLTLVLFAALLLSAGPTRAIDIKLSQAIGPEGGCAGNACLWDPFLSQGPNPTGDIWVRFESQFGAMDMAHFEVFPGDFWDVRAGFLGNIFITQPFIDIQLTDMDVPLMEGQDYLLFPPGPGVFNVIQFQVAFLEHLFIHDLHFDCSDFGVPCEQFDTNLNMGLDFLDIQNFDATGNPADFVTGIWEMPEPGTVALLALGLLAAGHSVRRRR